MTYKKIVQGFCKNLNGFATTSIETKNEGENRRIITIKFGNHVIAENYVLNKNYPKALAEEEAYQRILESAFRLGITRQMPC